jgi:cytochrome oxidase assembly protein ShyY1
MSARRWHRPSLFAIALTLLGTLLFVGLGVWQIARAHQKQVLLTGFAEAAREAPRDFASVRDKTDTAHFPHVRIAGKFLAGRGYLLDERVHDGKLGVHAFGVFAGDGESALLLVDRGWIAWDHAPGTAPSLPSLPDDAVELIGIYAPWPGSGLHVGGNALQRQTSWPKLTLTLEPAAVGADLGKPVLPRILLLDAAPDSGFVREWTPNVIPPSRHIAYAVQWFGFALAALAAFIVIHWRKTEEPT